MPPSTYSVLTRLYRYSQDGWAEDVTVSVTGFEALTKQGIVARA